MSFDGFFLHHMTTELREQVLYGRIQKVNQPFERELVLTIRNNRQNYKLLLSAHHGKNKSIFSSCIWNER